MSRTPSERLQDILDAIARARVADDRMAKAESTGDDEGIQVAFEAILHNLFVVGEAVKAIPSSILESAPETPWSDIAALRDVIGHHYHRIVPEIIHRTVQVDLGPLESTSRRLLESL